jgi:hypothetical protein
MKVLMLAAVSALALTAAGCGRAGGASAVVTGRLDCPSTQGDLTRVSEAADGKTCLYRISDGAEVSLQLIPVAAQGADATLAQIEVQLKAQTAGLGTPSSDMPTASKEAAAQAQTTKAEAAADAAQAAAADSQRDADRDARAADREARHADRDARHADRDAKRADRDAQTALDRSIEAQVNAKLREKGIDVDNEDGNDEAHINLPGLHIDAGGERADVRVGPIHVNASGDTATVKSVQDVRMRGEGFSMRKRGIRAMFVYAGDDIGGGYKYVGYEASGPRTGPLAVAVVKSKADSGFHGDIYGDVKRLVRRNGGT